MSAGDYANLPKRQMEELAFDYIEDVEARIKPEWPEKFAKLHRVQSQADSIMGQVEPQELRDEDQDRQR
jgi:hypothetical protein